MDTAGTKNSWFSKIKESLSKTSVKLTEGISGIFTRRKLDQQALEELEDLLISADLGVETTQGLIKNLKKEKFEKDVSDEEVRQFLAAAIEKRLAPYERTWKLTDSTQPYVILMIGVNGSGKTTTLGKLAYSFKEQGKKVCLAAGDTFRAAAVGQLEAWASKTDVSFFESPQHREPAGLAYASYLHAKETATDVLMIDTAGRLHTNKDLMAELSKIKRVLQKLEAHLPHEIILVLDGTLGQNSYQQVKMFQEVTPLTGLIITKLDGTAKGGALVSVVEKTALPILAMGVGENLEDLKPFSAKAFAYGLMGLTEIKQQR